MILLPCNAHYLRNNFSDFISSILDKRETSFAYYGGVPHISIDHYQYDEAALQAKFFVDLALSPLLFIPANYGYSIFSRKNTELYNASLSYFSNCIKAAKLLGAKSICIRPSNGLLSETKDELLENAVYFFKSLLKFSSDKDIQVEISTSCHKQSAAINTISDFEMLFNTLDNKTIGVALDTYSMGIAGESILEWRNKFESRIHTVLLADGNLGGYKALGDGVLPVNEYLNEIVKFKNDVKVVPFFPEATVTPGRIDRIIQELSDK